jgi:hypothetical protein
VNTSGSSGSAPSSMGSSSGSDSDLSRRASYPKTRAPAVGRQASKLTRARPPLTALLLGCVYRAQRPAEAVRSASATTRRAARLVPAWPDPPREVLAELPAPRWVMAGRPASMSVRSQSMPSHVGRHPIYVPKPAVHLLRFSAVDVPPCKRSPRVRRVLLLSLPVGNGEGTRYESRLHATRARRRWPRAPPGVSAPASGASAVSSSRPRRLRCNRSLRRHRLRRRRWRSRRRPRLRRTAPRALMVDPKLGIEDARFMVVTCSAFGNYTDCRGSGRRGFRPFAGDTTTRERTIRPAARWG